MVALSGELILVSLLSATNSSTWRCLLGSNLPLVETSYFSRHSAYNACGRLLGKEQAWVSRTSTAPEKQELSEHFYRPLQGKLPQHWFQLPFALASHPLCSGWR